MEFNTRLNRSKIQSQNKKETFVCRITLKFDGATVGVLRENPASFNVQGELQVGGKRRA